MRHYELYSWSHQYRQEMLAEASRLHLEGELREVRKARGQRNLGSALWNAIASLRAPSKSNDSPAVDQVNSVPSGIIVTYREGAEM
jgi:hypothetical protein